MEFPDQIARKAKIRETMGLIKNKFLVLSGKGGVGKSTVAVHLAVALSNRGFLTGLLDIDLHGPSIPKMMGLSGQKVTVEKGLLKPLTFNEKLKIISMASILDDQETAVIWRGPRKGGAIRQLLGDVHWGPLDFLIIDAPPGTGDESLSIAQLVPGVRAIVVTTPQQVAIEDVRRSLQFLNKVSLDIVGVIENMSGLICPHCREEIDLFKKGGGEALAREWGVPFLGRIPLDPNLVLEADSGRPYFEGHEDSAVVLALNRIVDEILKKQA
ncbi:MAG: Mrp/NBP35 family ATP-binding protein [Deltaproteobacteria bacterium]|nr:Mrp/NBP35 family ATP-binding protein [Deltaproteobacteria bacterium]